MVSPDHYVPLTNCCQGCFGLVDMPSFVEQAIRLAYQMYVPPPTSPALSLENYLESKKLPRSVREMLAEGAIFYEPVPYYSIGVDQIMIRHEAVLSPRLSGRDIHLSPDLVSAYHPIGRGTAYTLFQFIYHEKNVHLAEPALIWIMLKRRRFELLHNLRKTFFAVLIQLHNIQEDIRRSAESDERPHYRRNIMERVNLTPADRITRTRLFNSLIPQLIAYTEREIGLV